MKTTYKILFVSLIICLCFCCSPQAQQVETSNSRTVKVGGPCEGCDAVLEYGERTLLAVDTLPSFLENEPRLKITGTVFQQDGKTPASDVILYIYHTNRDGLYEKLGDEEGWGKRHGYIRGWIKTSTDGRYTFYTFRPGAYPQGSEPEHIHITVKEPERNEYYLDDYVFEDDSLMTKDEIAQLANRGGSGLVLPVLDGGIYLIERDIILGQNIPDYE